MGGRNVAIASQICFPFSIIGFLKSLRVCAHQALPPLENLIKAHYNYHDLIKFRNYIIIIAFCCYGLCHIIVIAYGFKGTDGVLNGVAHSLEMPQVC